MNSTDNECTSFTASFKIEYCCVCHQKLCVGLRLWICCSTEYDKVLTDKKLKRLMAAKSASLLQTAKKKGFRGG